ncbi:MAG: LysM peptidoglycan-binding domain-containing protein [Chloroflexota bacterium]|nr:LysM peptidoglycan-binding domain-containing protein [Chloroflexota bacterium]
MGLEKAQIKNLDTNETIECMFRPKEYTFAKTNTWQAEMITGKNVPKVEFSGGQAMTLKMELFFDTYETGKDVRKTHTDKIWKLMMINPDNKDKGNKGWPPQCEFRWGQAWSFKAVITNISQKFTLFLPDGTPVRSTMNVTFLQAAEEGQYPGQNPTTVSKPGYKVRKVKQGETLDWIAFDEYGDSNHWRYLADINNLDDPMRLAPGQVLAIAPLT